MKYSQIDASQRTLLKKILNELRGKAQETFADAENFPNPTRKLLDETFKKLDVILTNVLNQRSRGEGVHNLQTNFKKCWKDIKRLLDNSLPQTKQSLEAPLAQYMQAMLDVATCENFSTLNSENTRDNVISLADKFYADAHQQTVNYLAARDKERRGFAGS